MAVKKPAQKPAPTQKAKPSPSKAVTPKNAIATRQSSDVSTDLASLMEQDTGTGLSTDMSDNLVPLVYILQPLSPQAMKRNEAYIEDSEPGNIWLKNSDDQLHDEIWFQPCHFSKEWVEWIPRKKGGGYAGRHPSMPDAAEEYRDPDRPQSIRHRMPNGNDIVETRYYAGFVLREGKSPLPYTIPLASTGHTFGKALMFQLNSRQGPKGGKAPMFANKVRISTELKTNNAGEWYMYKIEEIEFIDDVEQYMAGRNLNIAFEKGEKKSEAPDLTGEYRAEDDGGDM